MKNNTLATAGTIDGILSAISDFYCGSIKQLIPTGDSAWKVSSADGARDAQGVRVVLAKGRYRFEMVA
jgi:hypothetical protein